MRPIKYPELPILLIVNYNDFLNRIMITLRSNSINHIYICSDSKKVKETLQKDIYSIIGFDMATCDSAEKEILTMHTKEATLEEIFIKVTGRELV